MRTAPVHSAPGKKLGRTKPPGRRAKPRHSSDSEKAVPLDYRQLQEELLAQITHGARLCAAVERQLSQTPAPELETLIKLYRVLILKFSLEAEVAPGLFRLANDLMKPVMDWARLEEKRRERELAEQKYRDQAEAQKADRDQQAQAQSGAGALRPETIEKIHNELSLL
jgi:hypothetical protein